MGQIGLPDIQRPFVWSKAKVRDLFDSMCRGYPVGFFLFWETSADGVETNVIGDSNKQKAPAVRIVDGQQRLTSLYAVTLATMMRWHALSPNWWTLRYDEFLVARRPLIADVIRQGYAKLAGAA